MKQFLLVCGVGIALLAGVIGTVAWSDLQAFAREHGLLQKTDETKFFDFKKELSARENYKADLAVPLEGPGAEIATAIGVDAVRNSLMDPASAKFSKAIVTHNSAKGKVFVCGLVNAKNKFGAYVGREPFYIELDLASSIEGSKGWGPHFFNSGGYGGRPGDVFAERCGVGFLLEFL